MAFQALYVIQVIYVNKNQMDSDNTIERILSDGDLPNPSLISWIKKSDKNLRTYVAYKNMYALMQDGAEMTESEILNDFDIVKEAINRHNSSKL